ncbi:chloride channel protein [Agrobacterium sp. 16-2014-1-2a]
MSSPESLNEMQSAARAEAIPLPRRGPVSVPQPVRNAARMIALACCCGLLSGIAAMCLALTLRWIQHVAYGYSLSAVIGPESFVQGVSDAAPLRRFFVLCVCGLVAGVGWCGLARYGRRLVSVRAATDQNSMPVAETVLHAVLQVVTVALGSPLGREVAPRELGALLAQRFAAGFDLDPDQYRLLLSCGAGAGLAAVYNVPVAATVFIMEVMMRQARWAFLWPAAAATFTAAVVASFGLGDEFQYTLPAYPLTWTLIGMGMLMGPVFGTLGFTFRRVMAKASFDAATDFSGVIRSLGAFAFIGMLAMKVPEVLGNGKGPAELAFNEHIAPMAVLSLLTIKLTAIALSLRVGAKGGLLTPGLSIGALLGLLLGSWLSAWFPGVEGGALALIGAAAFLSSSMTMPLTAVCLVMEFTDAPLSLVLPIALAAAGSELARRWFDRLANPTQTVTVAS